MTGITPVTLNRNETSGSLGELRNDQLDRHAGTVQGGAQREGLLVPGGPRGA